MAKHIIITEYAEIEELPKISVKLEDFISIVNISNPDFIYYTSKYGYENTYFILNNGVMTYTQFIPLTTWNDFTNHYKTMINEKYASVNEYDNAVQHSINSKQEYDEFQKSGFSQYDQRLDGIFTSGPISYNINQDLNQKKVVHKQYQNYINSGFKSVDDFNKSDVLGISNASEFYQYISSEWSKDSYYAYQVSREDYQEYKQALQRGFTVRREYWDANSIGIHNALDYKLYLENKEKQNTGIKFQYNTGDDDYDDEEDSDSRSPNDQRSDSYNPNSDDYRAAANNRSNQMNPNNSAYRSSKGGRGRK